MADYVPSKVYRPARGAVGSAVEGVRRLFGGRPSYPTREETVEEQFEREKTDEGERAKSPSGEKRGLSPEEFKKQQMEAVPKRSAVEGGGAGAGIYSMVEDGRFPGVFTVFRAGDRDSLNDLVRSYGQKNAHFGGGFKNGDLDMFTFENTDEMLRALGPKLTAQGGSPEASERGSPAEDAQGRVDRVTERLAAMEEATDRGRRGRRRPSEEGAA